MAAVNGGHDGDVVDEITGMTELYNPGCCLVKSVKEDSDLFSKATDLDDKKKNLLTTYLDFNSKLWTGKIKEDEKDQIEDDIRKNLEKFQDAVSKYGMKNIFEKHCVLYREIEINGVKRTFFKKKNQEVEIKSAFTDIIKFPDYDVSLKTAKGKQDKKGLGSEIASWKAATQDYLDRYYPTEGVQVFRIPPSLEYDDELHVKGGKKPLARDALLQPDEKAVENLIPNNVKEKHKDAVKGFFDKRRGIKAESEILIAFEKWGRDSEQNMFIFGGYKYSNYLKNVHNLESITSEQGEFDVLIISEQLGVIFVEVKGSVGAQHVSKASGGEKTDVVGDGVNVGAELKYENEKGKDSRSNVATVANPDRSPDRQAEDLINGHRLSNSEGEHTNSEKVSKSGDIRVSEGQGKPNNLRTVANGSSYDKIARDAVPIDVSQSTSSDEKDIGKYKQTTFRSIQSEIQDGWRQLMKGNFVFREMNRDLSFVRRLPFKAFVGLPFLSLSDLNDACICNHHQRYLICNDDLDRLQDWLEKNHFSEGYDKKAMSHEEFRELAARFAGLASAVTTEIDTIKFTNRKMMCTFLTPEQTAILHDEQKHAVLFGDYGTGKTFVLTRKATSLMPSSMNPQLKSKRKQQVFPVESTINVVHIIPCADLSNFKSCYGVTFSDQARDIKKFVKPNEQGNENIKIYESFLDFHLKVTGSSPDRNAEVEIEMLIHAMRKAAQAVGVKPVNGKEQQNISNGTFVDKKKEEVEREGAIGEEVRERKVAHHFFFDEFPVHPLKGGALKRLQKFLIDDLKESYLWISVATHSLGVSPGKNPSKVLKKELSIANDEDVLFFYLKDVMRVSEEVYKMIKEIEAFIGKGHFNYSNLGHMLKGIKPRLFKLPERKCESPEYNALSCECQVENLASTLRRILDAAVDKYGEPLVVTIMIYYVMSTPMFRRLRALLTRVAQVLNIELIWNTMQSRYTEENLTEFTNGPSQKVDSPSKESGALETPTTEVGNGRLKQIVKSFRSPCPAKGGEKSELKNLSTEWKIQVVDQRTFAGCETPVLIFIDLFGMRHWFKRGDGKGSGYHSLIFTRCTGHFILITWPNDESQKMWYTHLDEYEAEIKRSDASEKFKKGRYDYINTGRSATEHCLQMLLDKDLIVKMTNEAD